MLPFLLFSAWLSAWAQPASPVEVQWSTWEQNTRPEWARRQASARAKQQAATAFFAGQQTLEQAFPELIGARLHSLPAVQARLDALQRKASEREGTRRDAIDFGDPKRTRAALQLRNQALDAEEQADEALRKLLTRIEAHLNRHPHLSDAALQPILKILDAQIDAAPATDEDAQRAALSATALADQERAAWKRLQREALLFDVGGGASLDPTSDRVLLADPLRGQQASERLRLTLPFLDPSLRPAVQAELFGYANGPALQAAQQELQRAGQPTEPPTDPLVATEAVTRCVAEVKQLQAQVEALPTDDARVTWMPIRLEAAKRRLERAKAHVAALEEDSHREEEASEAAIRARREAEAAAAAAVDEEQKAQATLLASAADAGERLVAVESLVAELEADAKEQRDQWSDDLDQATALLQQAHDSSSLVRVSDLDAKYAKLRTKLMDLEASELARGLGVPKANEAAEKIRAQVQADQTLLRGAPDSEAMREWESRLLKESLAANSIVDIANRVYTDTLAQVRALTEVRRGLRGYANWKEQNNDQATSFQEVKLELSILWPSLGTLLVNRAYQIRAFPGRLIANGKLMADLAVAGVWLMVLLGTWSWARGKAGALAARMGMQVRRFRPDLRPLDLQRIKAPLTVAIQTGIDLVLGYLMMGRISELSGEIGFLVQCWLLVALFRFLLALFDVAVVKSPEFRPSLVALAPDAFDRVRYSAKVAFVWMIAKGFVYYICWTIFGMDAVTNLLMLLFNMLGLVLAVVIAHSWYPMLLERIQSRNQESRLVAFLSRPVPWVVQAPAAIALLGFFGATIFSDLWHFAIAHDKTGVATLFNVVSRYQMDESEQFTPPADEVCDKLCGRELGKTVHVDREEVDEEIVLALGGWRKESRRGLMALVGDRGMGKRTEIDRFAKQVNRDELQMRRLRLRGQVLTPEALYKRVATLAEIEPTTDPEVLIERLRAIDPAVLVLEQAHRTFSRSVAGFEAIQVLLYVMNATSDHHFWLVTMHAPAWNFLAAIPTLVDVGVFRSVVKLEPFSPPMLRELCENRMKAAGQQLDYSGLMRNNLLGADPKVELERATNTFYRLLAESSEGNPRVALRLFAKSLEMVNEHKCRVHTSKALSTEVAKNLGIQAMFTLVAIRQQDSMPLSEISEVTNQPLHTVRNLVRDLQSRGLVEQLDQHLYIPINKLPLVTRTLRRRHLIHLGT